MAKHRIHSLSGCDVEKVRAYAKSIGAEFMASGGNRGYFMTIESDQPNELKSLGLSSRATIDAKDPIFKKR